MFFCKRIYPLIGKNLIEKNREFLANFYKSEYNNLLEIPLGEIRWKTRRLLLRML